MFVSILLLSCESRPASSTDSSVPPASSVTQAAGAFRWVHHNAADWITFDLDLTAVDLALVGQAPNEPRTLGALRPFLTMHNRELVMATNAGIFNPAHRPVGLHIQHGQEFAPLSNADGEGNFYLKPNGVFWIDASGAHVAPTEHYAPKGKIELATQSGPLLTTQGRLHPAFVASSTSLRTRSGVGVDARGHVVFALSRERVTFYATATLFRDVLGCPDALYLDGEISSVAAPGLPAPEAQEYGGLLVATKRARP
ncbi:MAG TPA: phosphodiester glycosidase family protein [Polyangium sp.]|nr:phosphodiester glycosidase family protein [Polyangium sp.]